MIPNEHKINKEISKRLEPLFTEWKSKANWTKEEEIVIYCKLFDDDKPDDLTIIDILADELGDEYKYYHKMKVQRIYNKAKRKLNKILP